MKYVVIIESDDELSEDAIKNSEEILFLGDENAMYYCEITSITKSPKDIFENHISSWEMRCER